MSDEQLIHGLVKNLLGEHAVLNSYGLYRDACKYVSKEVYITIRNNLTKRVMISVDIVKLDNCNALEQDIALIMI